MTTTYNPGSSTNNTITINGTGSSGSGVTLATSGTMLSYPVINGTTSITSGSYSYNWNGPNDEVMLVKKDPPTLEVKGNLVINGIDLEERLNTIEKVLMIPERDVKLETKHPNLKKMYDDYIKALGKYRTWEAIKGDEDGTT